MGNGHCHDAMENETTQGHCKILWALLVKNAAPEEQSVL